MTDCNFLECLLINSPQHRPRIDQVLNSEWIITNLKPKKFSESDLEEARSIISHRRRSSFWCAPKSRNHVQPKVVEPKKPIECSTKKFNNVPFENFTNPIDMHSIPNHTTVIPISNNTNKFNRNNSLINSSKVIVKRNSVHRIGPIDIIQVKNAHSLERSYSHDNDNEEECIDNEKDFENFMLLPTNTHNHGDTIALHPLETETRKILISYGISCDQLERSIEFGPRSEIIAIYRIVITRLKTQSSKESLPSPNFSNLKKTLHTKQKNPTKICAIL